MQVKHRILCQIPGPELNAIKILPPVITTEEDIQYFLDAFEDTLASYYSVDKSPIRSISRGFVNQTMNTMKSAIPGAAAIASMFSGGEKKKSAQNVV
jgi:ornithine--oxo-acid transaminase